MQGGPRVYRGKSNNIIAEIAVLVLDKVEFRPRCIKQDKEATLFYNA